MNKFALPTSGLLLGVELLGVELLGVESAAPSKLQNAWLF